MEYKMYGIPNCDTVKKARRHLELKKIPYEFIDFKKTPPTDEDIQSWEKIFGELPVNKKGPTFRKYQEEFNKSNRAQKIKLMINQPSMIKRPILTFKNKILAFGYDESVYSQIED